VPQQLSEVIECIDVVEFAGVDQLTGQGRDSHTGIIAGVEILIFFPVEIFARRERLRSG
jgi:hypothetical protein